MRNRPLYLCIHATIWTVFYVYNVQGYPLITSIIDVMLNTDLYYANYSDCLLADPICPNGNVTFWLYTSPETKNDPFQLNLEDEDSLEKAPFLSGLPVKMLIHGYTGHRNFSPNTEIRPVYLEKGGYNVISVDYQPWAPYPCYPRGVRNIQTVANCTAMLIDALIDAQKIVLEDLHVIGFSLGAQVSSQIGGFLKHGQLERLTGLDPAQPLFLTADEANKLTSDKAKFVDVLHTNPGYKGMLPPCGHVDFYFNWREGLQPGCKTNEEGISSCEHRRAPEYYAESIVTEVGFWGYRCPNFKLNPCSQNEAHSAGENVNKSLRGTLYVETSAKSPFALGRFNGTDFTSTVG